MGPSREETTFLPWSRASLANPPHVLSVFLRLKIHSQPAMPQLCTWSSRKSCCQGASPHEAPKGLRPLLFLLSIFLASSRPGNLWGGAALPQKRWEGRQTKPFSLLGLLLTPGPDWQTSTPIVVPPTRRSPAALPTITRRVWAPTLA